VGVVDANGGKTRWLETPGDPRNTYIARMEWAANSTKVVLQHFNRLQNTLQLMLGDAKSGKVRTILTDQDSAWVDVVDDMRWLDGGKRFTWVSERDGWRHMYNVARDGSDPRLILRATRYRPGADHRRNGRMGLLPRLTRQSDPALTCTARSSTGALRRSG
jgi:dipeptidyl-peptidase-4